MKRPSNACILLTCVLCAASAVVGWAGGLLHSSEKHDDLGKHDDLPDSLTHPAAIQRKQAVLREGAAYFSPGAAQDEDPPFRNNAVVRGNYMAASAMVALFEKDVRTSPLMIRAQIAPLDGGWFLLTHAINCHRETDRLIIAAVTQDGEMVTTVAQYSSDMKGPSLLVGLGLHVRYVPLSEIMANGEKTPWGVSSVLSGHSYMPVPIPTGASIAVAIGDRDGQISNFVPVVQQLPLHSDAESEGQVSDGATSDGERQMP